MFELKEKPTTMSEFRDKLEKLLVQTIWDCIVPTEQMEALLSRRNYARHSPARETCLGSLVANGSQTRLVQAEFR